MPIDKVHIGRDTGTRTLLVDRGRLRLFAKATGQTDPVYTDLDAAKAAGHPDLPVPPTFFFAVSLETADPFTWLTDLGIDLTTVLHGEQEFHYHRLAHAGAELTATARITDVYDKRGGALEFLVTTTSITDHSGQLVAEAVGTTAIRRPAEVNA
ncbi:MaoC family dehydratase N-terminal domain-containing protein [Amycolatopsis sp. OK19-0408]|uniref:MaoC family dehydratase N-terminal domain-containing protein n=1 Tax=Amycolatopsis iheyensis TaxID=2945988 RepID=A0A9X2SLW9_9PSEU|nr:MaoC family dehydratase N-terminal domain-containing protein [Amycolatopsis iheyensis]MCR6485035.1 MaoC family dehydratase N-terminal domain-containing protein [Amycolatopsis iheyensis]